MFGKRVSHSAVAVFKCLPAGRELEGQPAALAKLRPNVRRSRLKVVQRLFDVVGREFVQTGGNAVSQLGLDVVSGQ